MAAAAAASVNQRWLKDLGLPQHELQLLGSQNILTARDLLTQTALDLVERLNIPFSRAQSILQHAAMQVAPAFTTVSSPVTQLPAQAQPHKAH